MSWQALKALMARSRLKRSRAFVVLVALAEHANRDGWAWPSVALLASETELSRRSTLRHLREAEAAGELRRERHGPRGTRYQLRPGGEAIGANGGTRNAEASVPRVAPTGAAKGASDGTDQAAIGANWGLMGAIPRPQRAAEPLEEPPSLRGTELTGVPRLQRGPSHIEDGVVSGGARPAAETALPSTTIACRDPSAHRLRYHILHLDGRLRCSACDWSGAGVPTA